MQYTTKSARLTGGSPQKRPSPVRFGGRSSPFSLWGAITMQSDSEPLPDVPRQLSLVRFRHEVVPSEHHAAYPFKQKHTYVFFGEIPNMPGHCVVADHVTGQIFSGYHTENFVEIDEDEA